MTIVFCIPIIAGLHASFYYVTSQRYWLRGDVTADQVFGLASLRLFPTQTKITCGSRASFRCVVARRRIIQLMIRVINKHQFRSFFWGFICTTTSVCSKSPSCLHSCGEKETRSMLRDAFWHLACMDVHLGVPQFLTCEKFHGLTDFHRNDTY